MYTLDNEAIRAAYLAGDSTSEIAIRYQVGRPVIERRLRESGVDFRGFRKDKKLPVSPRPSLTESGVAAACAELGSIALVAQRYGVNITFLRDRCHEWGIEIEGGRRVAPEGTQWEGDGDRVLVKEPGHHNAKRNGWIYRSRKVASEMLGRPLEPGECVWHKNNDPTDDAPENLVVYNQNEPGAKFWLRRLYNRDAETLRPWDNEEIFAALRDLAAKHPGGVKEKHIHAPYPPRILLNRRFGHWARALKLATDPVYYERLMGDRRVVCSEGAPAQASV